MGQKTEFVGKTKVCFRENEIMRPFLNTRDSLPKQSRIQLSYPGRHSVKVSLPYLLHIKTPMNKGFQQA